MEISKCKVHNLDASAFQITKTNITTVMAFKLAFNGIILLDEVARENTNEVTWN